MKDPDKRHLGPTSNDKGKQGNRSRMRFSTSLVVAVTAALCVTSGARGEQRYGGDLENLLERQDNDGSNSSSSSGSQASSTSSSSGSNAQQTPGFVYNGTVGTYPCALPQDSSAFSDSGSTVTPQHIYSPFQVPGADCADALPPVYPYNAIRIRSPDDSMRMTFLPYGASVSEVWVKDRNDAWQDVVLGFDNKTNYGTDKAHNFFGPVVGRYANRIKNGTFELDGKTYHTPLNENDVDTLHGGSEGYDRASWYISALNQSSVTFTHHDPSGNQGFPATVDTTATYTLLRDATWQIRIKSKVSNGKTPLMLSSHVYWNLNPHSFLENTSRPILDHVLHMPYATNYVKTDPILIPTGPLPKVDGTGYDFRTAKPLSENFNQTQGYCGGGCKGWDSCWIEPKGHPRHSPSFEVYSPQSGIKLSISSNQEAWQIYTTAGLVSPDTKPSVPRKRVHGGDGTLDNIYENYSAMVIEAEDYIDAINNPEWGRNQIYDENRDYDWEAEYKFSTVDKNGKAT